MAIEIIVHGAGGRMGVEVARAALAEGDVRLAGGIDAAGSPAVGRDMGALCGLSDVGTIVQSEPEIEALKQAVVVDFTIPAATLALLAAMPSSAGGIVIGTTGFTKEQRDVVVQASKRFPVLMSPNMSLGVNLLFHLTGLVAARLGDAFDIEITEAHHRHKKDAPSGTAVRLGEVAAEALGRKYGDVAQHGRSGMVGERPRAQIGMHALRGGDIVGDHTVLFAGPHERIELRHMAHSRAVFAQGAVAAAKWLAGREPGLYGMGDVLGF
ncbi:MAG: 4-hydroxy-tetrahydrodipicolinate reductase [Chitinivibrionales bacterium]|nr:4-hydroxy-tetrahydrodipicolinate reductase [Chitinivibrionales bacterium]